ncbi:hypothetical protein Bca101_049532 [Brassica carinata]
MTQAQLVGKSGDGKSGEGNGKRLKIYIPHFDNSDLIKSYSKTDREMYEPGGERCHSSACDVTENLEGGREGLDFKGGEYYEEEEALVTLQFEKLCGHCSLCLSLCHDLGNCTLNPNPEKKKESREGAAVRKDDRARSYKGVVTNGEGGHQENDKNPRRYQGKGKGKMYEEQESKWERVPEGRSKRSFSNRNHNKFEEGGSRNRNSRWEKTRRHSEEERSRPSRATCSERNPLRGERSPVRRNREEPREEGEIWLDESDRGRLQQEVEKSLIPPPGPAQETSPLPGDPDQVTLITGELENGLDLVSEFLEDGTNTLEQDKIIADLDFSGEVGMELGETDHTRTETESGLELDDEFQNLRDREGKDMNQVEAKEVVEEDMTGDIVEGKGATAAEKKPGLRKPLFSVSKQLQVCSSSHVASQTCTS